MFKDELKRLRSQKVLSQAELAEKLNVAASTVGMWESGKREPSSHNQLKIIADFFGVDIGELIGSPDERNGEKEMAKTKETNDMLTMEVEQCSFPGGTPWFRIMPKEYNIILSIVAVTRKPIEDVVYDLLRYAISRTKVTSEGKTLLDVSQIYEK